MLLLAANNAAFDSRRRLPAARDAADQAQLGAAAAGWLYSVAGVSSALLAAAFAALPRCAAGIRPRGLHRRWAGGVCACALIAAWCDDAPASMLGGRRRAAAAAAAATAGELSHPGCLARVFRALPRRHRVVAGLVHGGCRRAARGRTPPSPTSSSRRASPRSPASCCCRGYRCAPRRSSRSVCRCLAPSALRSSCALGAGASLLADASRGAPRAPPAARSRAPSRRARTRVEMT